MSRTPFRDRLYPCARCSRDVRVSSVFYHYRAAHDEGLVRAERDGTDACALCGMELPPEGATDAWKLRVRHFRDYHGKRLVDADAIR
ncbi:hypothetical protein [Halorussus halobius]|uniref:hypothetical protein n=1 Tax=Halorussus halobius TaxID=1710537 RepID=UPI001092CC01|nr:hypothetical protein [Halorussus halobius]